MARKSVFDFDISVSADKKRRARTRSTSGAVEGSVKRCDHEGCMEQGKFRAPKSPDRLDDFFWFCKAHIREYNLKWNFFENHSDEELEEQVEKDRTWDRPTWSFKTGAEKAQAQGHNEGQAWKRFGFDDASDFLGENATMNPSVARADSARNRLRRLPQTERRALEIMGVEEIMTKTELRKGYKSLVKDLHPDMNGGNRDDEERLAEVVWAWEQVKASRLIPD